MAAAVIASAARTAIGRAAKGSLVDARPDDLVAFAIKTAVEQVPALDPGEIVDVMVGCGFPEQKQGMNLARRAALLAGLPQHVPGTTVNRFCASSLQTIRMAFHAIKAGEGDAFVAAGVESITQVDGYPKSAEELHPKLFVPPPSYEDALSATQTDARAKPARPEGGAASGALGDDAPIANVYIPMGMTAENVAERYGVSREEMDRFGQRSQERAVAAQDSGFFDREITPYPLNGSLVARDDGPRRESTLEKLAELEPVFKPGGSVTAGNSCPLNDGAAAVVVMSDTKARELGIEPRARIIASAVSGVEPEIMGVGPIEAVRKVLKQAGMTIDDVDVVELNEAFAAQVLPVCNAIGVDPFSDKLNPHGGAIALGHPYGMTGARIMCTLLNDLETLDRTIGLETMCVGGGQGMAMLVERLR
jgi:acetyl-CoA C-acetyltransferase